MFNDSQLSKILTERSLLDIQTLKKAQRLQGDDSLYEAISKNQLVAVEILRELAEEIFEIPSADIRAYHIDSKLTKLVPASMAFRNRVIPLELNQSSLVLGMFDPTDLLAMDEISTRTGISIKPMGVDPRELKLALEEYYGGHDELRSMDGLLDFETPEVDSLVDDVMSEMGWDEMFDGEEIPDDEAQKMRDRPTTGVLDIDSGDIEIADDDALLAGLDDPISGDDAPYELDEWDIDSEIELSEQEDSKSKPPEAALIMSKDSVNAFYGKDDEGGIAQIDSPPTREVEVFSDQEDGPISSVASEDSSATKEITPTVLDAIFDSSLHKSSSLEEKTAAHPDEINRLTGIMKTLSGKNPGRKSGSITPRQSVAELAKEVDFKIPDDVSEKLVLEAVVRLLIAQGLIDKNALLELLKADS